LFTLQATAESKPFKPVQAPRWGRLHILTFKQLAVLPKEKISSYLQDMRLFLVSQENKKTASLTSKNTTFIDFRTLGLFSEIASADDSSSTQSSCVDRSKLNAAQAQVLDSVGDQCIIGGYMVCMNYVGGRLRCSPSDVNYRILSVQS
jgi:hypothetical protein